MGDNEYKKRHKKLGLCVNCSENAVPGETRCAKHILSMRKSFKKWYKNNIETRTKYIREKRELYRKIGRCPQCTNWLDFDVDAGYISCQNCRERFHFGG